ncbi:hypothetical protein PPERSA_10415 [Pseudocohnilembus persalinus]|uniref:Insulin-like growth factor binding protein, N-terminal n=1 Tax=Pseudocohnilembus persalinus TaxID=266149 RepID=A0A0V0QWU8_PSEPJ|nr:hypothetical protein PPERSA_10415 [Pseudocohnilembus persalinus]|eukprot:KRX06557.1 hypothetical protein PPERSA_10415 [Pseudocohnilembus persalinus]
MSQKLKLQKLIKQKQASNYIFLVFIFIIQLNSFYSLNIDPEQLVTHEISESLFFIENFQIIDSNIASYDQIMLNQFLYVSVITGYINFITNQIIIFTDENGQIISKTQLSGSNFFSSSLSKTNLENEVFYAYIQQQQSGDYKKYIYIAFLTQDGEFTRNTQTQSELLIQDPVYQKEYEQILTKYYQNRIYILAQRISGEIDVFFIDISMDQSYNIINQIFNDGSTFSKNQFSFLYADNQKLISQVAYQGSQDTYFVIFDLETQLVTSSIPSLNNPFLHEQLKNQPKQIPGTENQYNLISGDYMDPKIKITTYEIQDQPEKTIIEICHTNINIENFNGPTYNLFKNLQYGNINKDYTWIKGQNKIDNKNYIFFLNPQNCQFYENQNGQILFYEIDDDKFYNVLHTYSVNQEVNLILYTYKQDSVTQQKNAVAKILSLGYLYEGCDEGQFSIYTEKDCQNCIDNCQKCKNNLTCDTCQSPNFQLNGDFTQCICAQDYLEYKGQCVTQKQYDILQQQEENVNSDNNNNKKNESENCGKYEFYSSTTQKCTECYYYKEMCVQQCPKANDPKNKYYKSQRDTILKIEEDGKKICYQELVPPGGIDPPSQHLQCYVLPLNQGGCHLVVSTHRPNIFSVMFSHQTKEAL